ncbi:MAG: alanine dehydrogenase [Cellulosilyticaceae bacterium]
MTLKIGCVKEIKQEEYRVGMTPDHVKAYRKHGHEVFIQAHAGEGSGFTDDLYVNAGAVIVDQAEKIWKNCEMIVKVKEPLSQEYGLLRKDQIVYTYLHLAASEALTRAMLASGCIGVAYETIEDANGLPCLKPMSEIAGRLAVQEGAKYLEKPFGGRGVLLGGVPGVKSGKVVILGAGIVGTNALKIAVGMGADVTIMDINMARLTFLDNLYENRIKTLYATPAVIEAEIETADLVIGAVLITGAAAPRLISGEDLKRMKKGAVLVDVAVDQGGCFETTKVTYHNQPVFEVEGIVHYCVGNMPGAVPYTSTMALTNATLSYGLAIADKGIDQAMKDDPGLLKGVNIYKGNCTYQNVADTFGIAYQPLKP